MLVIKRYDDIYKSTKGFFEEFDLPEKLIKPVIFKICEAMRNIYKVYNINLKKIDRDYLFSLRILYGKLNQEAQEETDELNLSNFSEMSLDESEDLPFFKLNKSF
jgi:hypothetical protein